MSKKTVDLKSLCRICMSNRVRICTGINASKSRLNIHEKPTGNWNEGLTILDLLRFVQPKIKVHLKDRLPKLVCNDCIDHLQMTYEFLKMSKDTDDKFRKILKEDDATDDEQTEPECNGTNVSTRDHHPKFEAMFIDSEDDSNGDRHLSDNTFVGDSDDENEDGTSMESSSHSLLKKMTTVPGRSSKRVIAETDSPPKKTKRVHSANKHASNSYSNFATIEENVDEIKVTTHQLKGQIKLVMDALAEQNVLLKKLLRQQCEDMPLQRKFPLTTEQELEEINSEITEENRKAYITSMRPLLHPLPKNLQNILSNEVIAAYNIDGIHGKLSLKALTNFYSVLLDSIRFDEDVGTVEEQLRKAIQLQKKRYFKRISRSKNL